jgi:hypothetical protein
MSPAKLLLVIALIFLVCRQKQTRRVVETKSANSRRFIKRKCGMNAPKQPAACGMPRTAKRSIPVIIF